MGRRRLGGIILLIIVLVLAKDSGIDILPSPGEELVPEAGKRVLMVYESSELGSYPFKQTSILQGETIATYLDGAVDKDDEGNPLYRRWDKDVNLEYVDKVWKAAMELAKAEPLPHLIILNGNRSVKGPLPDDVDQALSLLKKHLE